MRIFIGSSKEAHEKGILLDIARIVEECKMTPIRWNQSPSVFPPGKFTLEVLEEIIRTERIDASIFIFSDDDKTWYRGNETIKPRDNVIFEHGLFSGRLGRENSVIIKYGDVELPSDLSGITYIDYSEGNKTKGEINLRQWILGLGQKDSHSYGLANNIDPNNNENYLKIKVYKNLELAKTSILEKVYNAREIKVLANKGLEFFGSDSSIISLAETEKYSNLKRLKIVLLSPNSKWVNRGFMALRKYETIEDFKSELESTHIIVEMGMKRFLRKWHLSKSGIKYHYGEPLFRFIMVDDTVFVSTYAENPTEQVKDLPVFEIYNGYGSIYGSLKKHFNDLWINNSEFGKTLKENIDIEISAGGLVFQKINSKVYLALVQREDGSWVLPKGHRKNTDKNMEETAIREVSEETGLEQQKIHCIRKIDTYAHDEIAEVFDINKINYFYLMEYVSDGLDELHTDFEHMSAKWWDIKEELPFMFYIYQKILIYETIKKEFSIEAKMHER